MPANGHARVVGGGVDTDALLARAFGGPRRRGAVRGPAAAAQGRRRSGGRRAVRSAPDDRRSTSRSRDGRRAGGVGAGQERDVSATTSPDDALVHEYRRALCVVLPSVYRTPAGETRVPELLGQTLLEGMACGAAAHVHPRRQHARSGGGRRHRLRRAAQRSGARSASGWRGWPRTATTRRRWGPPAGRACCVISPGRPSCRAASTPTVRLALERRHEPHGPGSGGGVRHGRVASRDQRIPARHRRRERLHAAAGPRAGRGRRRGARVVSGPGAASRRWRVGARRARIDVAGRPAPYRRAARRAPGTAAAARPVGAARLRLPVDEPRVLPVAGAPRARAATRSS